MEIKNIAGLCDYFLIISAESNRQARAICDAIIEKFNKNNIEPFGVEGYSDSKWILLDFGDIIIHIFYEPMRAYYDLERLWIDAPRIDYMKMLRGVKRKKKKKIRKRVK